MKTCPACTRDPDPRGPSACAACRELDRAKPALDLSDAHVDRVMRRLYYDVMAARDSNNWRALAVAAIQLGVIIPADQEDPLA